MRDSWIVNSGKDNRSFLRHCGTTMRAKPITIIHSTSISRPHAHAGPSNQAFQGMCSPLGSSDWKYSHTGARSPYLRSAGKRFLLIPDSSYCSARRRLLAVWIGIGTSGYIMDVISPWPGTTLATSRMATTTPI